MKFGTRLYGAEPDAIVTKATRAEELGFESLWRGDHLLIPSELRSSYPYTGDGRPPFDASGPVLEVLTVLSYLAHATRRIRLATGILVLPLRDPVPVARAIQTLDVLSCGRVIVGVGVGWMKEEFALLGKDFHARGALATEGIELLRALWTEHSPHYEGRHFRVSGTRFEPKPVQKPHPPIIVGGESEAAVRRAATIGDGWYGHRCTAEEAAGWVTRFRRAREEHGRADEPFEVTVRADPDITLDEVRRLEEVGVDRLVLEVGAFSESRALDDVQQLERFADRVLGAVA